MRSCSPEGILIAGRPIGLPFAPDPYLLSAYKSSGGILPVNISNKEWVAFLDESIIRPASARLHLQPAASTEGRTIPMDAILPEDPRLVIISPEDAPMQIKSPTASLLVTMQGYQQGDSTIIEYGGTTDTISRYPPDPFKFDFVVFRPYAVCTVNPPKTGHRLILLYTLSNTASAVTEFHKMLTEFAKASTPPNPLSALPSGPTPTPSPQIYVFTLAGHQETALLWAYVAREASRYGFATLLGECRAFKSAPGEELTALLRMSSFTDWRGATCHYLDAISIDVLRQLAVIETPSNPASGTPTSSNQVQRLPGCILWNRRHQWPVICADAGWGNEQCIARCFTLLRELDLDDRTVALQNFAHLFRLIYGNRGAWRPIETVVAAAVDVFGAQSVVDVFFKMFNVRKSLHLDISGLITLYNRLEKPTVELRVAWSEMIRVLLVRRMQTPSPRDTEMVLSALQLCGASLFKSVNVLTVSPSNTTESLAFWHRLVKNVSLCADKTLVAEARQSFVQRLNQIISERCLRGSNGLEQLDISTSAAIIPIIVEMAVILQFDPVIIRLATSIPIAPLNLEPGVRGRFGRSLADTCKIVFDHDLRPTIAPFLRLFDKLISLYVLYVLGPQPQPPRIPKLEGRAADLGCGCRFCVSLRPFLSDTAVHRWHHVIPEPMHHSIYGPHCGRIAQGSLVNGCQHHTQTDDNASLYTYVLQKRVLPSDPLAPREEWERMMRGCASIVQDWPCRPCRQASIPTISCTICSQLKACIEWDEHWMSLKNTFRVFTDSQLQLLFRNHPAMLATLVLDRPPEHPAFRVHTPQITSSATSKLVGRVQGPPDPPLPAPAVEICGTADKPIYIGSPSPPPASDFMLSTPQHATSSQSPAAPSTSSMLSNCPSITTQLLHASSPSLEALKSLGSAALQYSSETDWVSLPQLQAQLRTDARPDKNGAPATHQVDESVSDPLSGLSLQRREPSRPPIAALPEATPSPPTAVTEKMSNSGPIPRAMPVAESSFQDTRFQADRVANFAYHDHDLGESEALVNGSEEGNRLQSVSPRVIPHRDDAGTKMNLSPETSNDTPEGIPLLESFGPNQKPEATEEDTILIKRAASLIIPRTNRRRWVMDAVVIERPSRPWYPPSRFRRLSSSPPSTLTASPSLNNDDVIIVPRSSLKRRKHVIEDDDIHSPGALSGWT